MLNFIQNGEGGARPLLIAHGLFGSARNWGVLSKRLSENRPVIAVDMRNHGSSPHLPTQSYFDMAADLAEVIKAHGGRADVLGHSMGGKAAMILALQDPDLVAHLVVADIAPVAYDHTQLHLIDAMQAVDLENISSRRDAEAALLDLVPEAGVRAFLLQSLDLKGDRPRWAFNLDALRQEMPTIIGFPIVTGRFEGPTLFLTGAASSYVKSSDHKRIIEMFPKAEFTAIDGAGHWLHAEKPREFEAEIRKFLQS